MCLLELQDEAVQRGIDGYCYHVMMLEYGNSVTESRKKCDPDERAGSFILNVMSTSNHVRILICRLCWKTLGTILQTECFSSSYP